MSLSFEDQFLLFSKFGDTSSDGTTMTLTQSDKWLQQAGILDGRKLTLTDTGYMFSRYKARTIHYDQYVKYLQDLAKTKGCSFDEYKDLMMNCGPPGTNKKTSGAPAKPPS